MDKVKEILVVARKHHFWILCGVAALAALVVWSMATSNLANDFTERRKTIDGQESSLAGISTPHPNETWTAGMEAETAKEKESVRAAWTRLYQDQKEKVYQWPKSLGDFLPQIARVEEGRLNELPHGLRVRYQRQVIDFAKELPKIVDSDVAELANTGTSGNTSPPKKYPLDQDGNPIYPDYKVLWEPQSQQEIFDTFNWEKTPSTTMIRHAQEELWVYEALCKAIAEVNRDARGSHDAPISAITQMAIAYMAHEDSPSSGGYGGGSMGGDRIMRVAQAGATAGEGDPAAMAAPPGDAGMGEGAGSGPPDPKQRGKEGGTGGRGGLFGMSGPADPAAADPSAAADPDEIWKGYRYVSLDGKPLTTAAEVEASALEYNLMPFRVRMMINPKEIDRLLIACRNSAMPIEVREVRIGEPQNAGASGGRMGGMSPRGPAGPGPRPSPRGNFGGEFGPGAGGPAMPAGLTGMPQQPMVSLEINGVVYIVKKPDPALLDTAAPVDGATPPADGTAPMAPTAWNRQDQPARVRSEALAWVRRTPSGVVASA